MLSKTIAFSSVIQLIVHRTFLATSFAVAGFNAWRKFMTQCLTASLRADFVSIVGFMTPGV